MKLLSADQIKQLDTLTIKSEPISSISLMERAANACVNYLATHVDPGFHFLIFCGKGNNGGDGLAIARLLSEKKYSCNVILLPGKEKGSTGYEKNLARIRKNKKITVHVFSENVKVDPGKKYIVIDALLGTGFNGELRQPMADIINLINQSGFPVFAIDIPSGLQADFHQTQSPVVQATSTLTFHVPKKSMLCKPGSIASGEIILLDIGLSATHYTNMESNEFLIHPMEVAQLLKPRLRESAKWNYGHALLIAGSKSKPGAALLAGRSCLRSGAGLCTLLSDEPVISKAIVNTPELMGEIWNGEYAMPKPEWLGKFDATGIGPGCGTDEDFKRLLKWFLQTSTSPLLLDADALNVLAENKTWLALSDAPKILTPHFREFCRLTDCPHDANQQEIDQHLLSFSQKFNSVVVLKSAYTRIAFPSGNIYINFTGNAGLAKAGSGDVLSGIITSLLAQGYTTTEAALLGVCLHGMAADMAISTQSTETLMPSDVTNALHDAFKHLHQLENAS